MVQQPHLYLLTQEFHCCMSGAEATSLWNGLNPNENILVLLKSGMNCLLGNDKVVLEEKYVLSLFCMILFVFREGKGGEKRKRNMDTHQLPLAISQLGLHRGPRHVPWHGMNWWPFSSQAGTQSTEPHQLGWKICSNKRANLITRGKYFWDFGSKSFNKSSQEKLCQISWEASSNSGLVLPPWGWDGKQE